MYDALKSPAAPLIASSATFLSAVRASDPLRMAAYQPPRFGWTYGMHHPDLLPPLVALSAEAEDTSDLLRRLHPSGEIVADLWTGLQGGACLVARRPPTLELLVQAGVRITVVPARGQTGAFEVMELLGPELTEKLHKGVRFWVAAGPSNATMQPAVDVMDIGPWWLRR